MAKRAGNKSKIFVGGYDLSTDLMDAQIDTPNPDLDTTGFGPGAHARINGLKDATTALRGFFENTALTGLNFALADLEADSLNGVDILHTIAWGSQSGLVLGDPAVSIKAAVLNGRAIPSAVDGVVGLNASLLGNGNPVDHHMVCIAPLTAQVAAGSIAGLVTAQSTNGGIGVLHVFAFQGTSNEVQTLTVTGTPTAGGFTLTFNGWSTAELAFNASAATIQAALEALPSIGTGNVLCAGGPVDAAPVTITFQGTLQKKNVEEITVAHTFDAGSIANATTTPGVGTCTVKIQDSADTTNGVDGTWADLITFSAVTGPTAERMEVSGTVDKGLRIISSGTLDLLRLVAFFKRL